MKIENFQSKFPTSQNEDKSMICEPATSYSSKNDKNLDIKSAIEAIYLVILKF